MDHMPDLIFLLKKSEIWEREGVEKFLNNINTRKSES